MSMVMADQGVMLALEERGQLLLKAADYPPCPVVAAVKVAYNVDG